MQVVKQSKDDAMYAHHCAAEWEAWRAYRDFSIWPRYYQPMAPRPNGMTQKQWEEDADVATFE